MAEAPIVVTAIGGQVLGLALSTGQTVWRFEMPNPRSPPRIHVTEHHVFVAGAHLVCLDYRTGGAYWQAALAKTYNNAGIMLVVDGRLLLSVGSEVHCYAIADGRPLWQTALKDTGGWDKLALGTPWNVAQADAR